MLAACANTYEVPQPRMALGASVMPACLMLCSATVNIYDTEGDRVVGRGNVTSAPTLTQSPTTSQSTTLRSAPVEAVEPPKEQPK
jgi:hypothetical protein